MEKVFWLKEVPTTLIDKINRYALATGSVRSAMVSQGAEYNGHRVEIALSVRGYFTATYIWSGVKTIARGSLKDCLWSAKQYHNKQHKGACVIAHIPEDYVLSSVEIDILKELGYEETDKEKMERYREETFPQYDLQKEVPNAMWYEEHFGSKYGVDLLKKCESAKEYRDRLDAALKERYKK